MTLYVMRHGETDWNRERRMQGRQDVGLNAAGIAQAQSASRELRERDAAIERIVSSHLRRAAESAAIVAEAWGLAAEFDERLAERAFGELEGRTQAEIRAVYGLADPESVLVSAYGIEPADSLLRRAREAIACLSDFTGGVLVVTHGSVIRALTGMPDVIGNGTIMSIRSYRRGKDSF